ncbi:uncharacterized protein LOC122621392 [Drosophila teissieri]|uniref:uncharacterized protein LOC122621392 n=1 Tax=Drosophila teissieri TaxID=7243 RepID=UPI001CBA2094|nr:uncharacterized protein LOC122621392 [Drosophila teissieri]
MRSAILFGLIVCLALSLVVALKESAKQSNDLSSVEKDTGMAAKPLKRAKRNFLYGPLGAPIGYGGFGYGAPYYGRPYYGGFGPFFGGIVG